MKTAPGPGLSLVEVPVPAPGRSDVLVRVLAGGICGTDLHIYRWDPWARSRVRPPRVIGHEFCGTVVAVGEAVIGVSVGDRIAGESHIACGWCPRCRHGQAHICERLEIIGVDRDGAFAEYVVMPATNAWRLDPGIPSEVGAVMDPLGNAVHTALATELVTRTVLITGCGPIGLMAIPICRMAGAALVVASDVHPGRLALAAGLGADAVLDAAAGDVADRVHDLTAGQGADVVLEMSGHAAGVHDALRAVRSGGWVGLLVPAGRAGRPRPGQRRDLQGGAAGRHLRTAALADLGADDRAAAPRSRYRACDHAPPTARPLRGGLRAVGVGRGREGDPDP